MSLDSAKWYLNTNFYIEEKSPKAFLFLENVCGNLQRITQDLEEYKSPLNGSVLNFICATPQSRKITSAIFIMIKQDYAEPILREHLRLYFDTNFPQITWMTFSSRLPYKSKL